MKALEEIIKSQKGIQKELTRQIAIDTIPTMLTIDYLIRNGLS